MIERQGRSNWHALARTALHPFAKLGPGIITGVADDDPSGIATYSQAGAQFGLNMLWTMPLAYPLMSAVQMLCARLGRVTGMGLAANIKLRFPPSVLRSVVVLLLVANTLNIAADLAAMGDALALVLPVETHIATVAFGLLSLGLQLFIPYHRYVHFLKWLTLSLLAYVAVLMFVHVPWADVVKATVWPHIVFGPKVAMIVVAVFGTTISPYLFFWQASEEVEDMHGGRGLRAARGKAPGELGRIAFDTWTGMGYSNLIAYSIILATALTLHAHGVTDIASAADAATALRPAAGPYAFVLFTIGIIGVGLIGVPVLAASGGYAMAEAMGWAWGLEKKASQARGFYGVITLSVLVALVIQLSPINPMRALVWSAVINGVVAVPLLVVLMRLVTDRKVMDDFVSPRPIAWLGWATVVVMAIAAVAMIVPIG